MAETNSIDILADRVDRLACAKCGHHMDLSEVEPFSEIVCPKCNTKQVAPMRLGSFLLIKEMGKGGMGSVYRAFDQTLGRYVAIKVMQKHLAEDSKFAENFIREARAAAALNHPNVVQIYSCAQEKGQLYIVMELVDGGRLDEMIEGGKALDEVFTLEVGVQVAKGLQAANEIGLIHGDIKPANILFDKQRNAKVVDFGLARFAAQQHLQPGEIWGTPYYIAPEKVRAQREDERADIYSLGATLYHVLAGHPPFEGETAKDVVIARLKSPAMSLRSVRPSLQPETADCIARTLEQDPARRYPTYKSLLADMEEAVRVARQRHGMPPPRERKSSKTPLVVGALVLLGLAAGAFLFWPSAEEPSVPLPSHIRPITAPDPAEPGEPPRPATHPEIVYAVQPFPGEAQITIEEAITAWSKGNAGEYEEKMTDLFNAMPRTGVERPWVGVLHALPAWVEKRDGDMMRHLRGIHDAQLRELDGDKPHPGAMPQALARFMLGRINKQQVNSVAEGWPAWFGDLAQFLFAAERIREAQVEEARTALETYKERSSDEVKWPYLYGAMADQWVGVIDGWDTFRAEKQEETGDRALRSLRAYRRNAPALLHRMIDEEIAATQQRIREARREEEEAERETQTTQVNEDLEKIEAARTELYPLAQARDFRRAATRARQLASPLRTDEGRAALDLLVESYTRMEDLRRFIMQGLQRNPAPQNAIPELGGDAMGATISAIRISLGGHGWRDLPWDQVSERLMASLAEHYIAQMPEGERADMTLSLAVFAYQTRGMRPAQLYAERAVQLDRGLRNKARALMPELEIK